MTGIHSVKDIVHPGRPIAKQLCITLAKHSGLKTQKIGKYLLIRGKYTTDVMVAHPYFGNAFIVCVAELKTRLPWRIKEDDIENLLLLS